MIIDLGRASESTKGALVGPFPEFDGATGLPCSFLFDDDWGVIAPFSPC